MQTLTYGMQVPETADKGSIFFPALEENFTQLDSHNHDGINSSKLATKSLSLTSQSIPAASWVSLGNGNYRQAVVLPSSMQYLERGFIFKNSVNGDLIYPSVEQINATSYYVYINDNTISLTVLYV